MEYSLSPKPGFRGASPHPHSAHSLGYPALSCVCRGMGKDQEEALGKTPHHFASARRLGRAVRRMWEGSL